MSSSVPNALSSSPPLELPAVARATSKLARANQRVARGVVFWGLVLIAIYALGGPGEQLQIRVPVGGFKANVFGFVAAAAFALAFVLRLYQTLRRPERKWYGSRGLTEEIKSFAWRYAMGGLPYDKMQSPLTDMDDRFSSTLTTFLRRARQERLGLDIPVEIGDDLPYITPWMTEIRGMPVDGRGRVYAEDRIRNQQIYYLTRARSYGRKARWWNLGLMGIEVVFAILAVASALNLIPLQFFGVAGTVVAAGAAWLHFTQYRALTDLYNDMAFELGEFHRRCIQGSRTWSEEQWANFVNIVENFLEAEHATWRKLVDPDGPDQT